MYNTFTAGKTEMLPFWWILPFWEGKREEGGQRCCAKTRFVLDCVGAQHRRNVYSACKGISPLLLGDWINAGITLLPGASRAQVQWRLRCLFPFFWQTTEWKIVAGWSLKSIKLLLPRSLISLSSSFFLVGLFLRQWHNPPSDLTPSQGLIIFDTSRLSSPPLPLVS